MMMSKAVIADRISPAGTTEVQASRLWTKPLMIATTKVTMVRTECSDEARRRRTPRVASASMMPAIAAITPMITPPAISQTEKLAHCISAVLA
jgi:hypothetical protein